MSRSARWLCTWCLALVVASMSLWSVTLHAQEDPFESLSRDQVEALLELLEQATAAEEAEDWGEALALYERAEAILSTDQYRYRQAVCLEALDRHIEALALYRQLADSEIETVARSAAARLRTLEDVVPYLPAPVRLRTEPSDVLLTIDGEEAGRAMDGWLEIRVEPGDHQLEARRAGFLTERRNITVEAGVVNEIDITLRPEPEEGRAAAGGGRVHPASWVLAGGAIAFLVGGTVFGVLAGDRAEQERTYDLRAPGATRDATDQLAEEAQDFARLANVGFVTGGVLAAGAIVTFFVLRREEQAPADSSPRLSVGPILAREVAGGQLQIEF